MTAAPVLLLGSGWVLEVSRGASLVVTRHRERAPPLRSLPRDTVGQSGRDEEQYIAAWARKQICNECVDGTRDSNLWRRSRRRRRTKFGTNNGLDYRDEDKAATLYCFLLEPE